MRCHICHSEKNLRDCDSCRKDTCRNCAHFLDRDRFLYHPEPPKLWKNQHFCETCYQEEVAPGLAHYDEVLEKAKEVIIVSKWFRGGVPCIKREHEVSSVKKHLDRKQAIMHLSFLAVWEGFDAIIQLETVEEKKRKHGYQHLEWVARGFFANLDHKRFRPDG